MNSNNELIIALLRSQIGVCEALIDANINVEANKVTCTELVKQINSIELEKLIPNKVRKSNKYYSTDRYEISNNH